MLLFEFDQNLVDMPTLVVLTNQLEQDLEDGSIGDDYTVSELLDYFQQYDIILDVNDLYNMIKVPPLKSVIKNIQGDDVVFVGQDDSSAEIDTSDSDNEKLVAKMAKRAMD